MEKSEKILATQRRTIRIVFYSITVTACFLLLWTFFNMQDDGPLANARPRFRTIGMNKAATDGAKKMVAPQMATDHLQLHDPAIEEMMVSKVAQLDQKVREIKKSLPRGSFMESDVEALKATRSLQDATRDLLHYRYGPFEPYRVRIGVRFKESNPTFDEGETDSFLIQLAPSKLMPHSIFTFLEIARHFHVKKGAFHRRAGHVLQAMVRGNQVPHLAFQEYSSQFPHAKGTVGYAGRPSGPAWYVSIQDNTKNHGPGSQQQENPYEADSCFAKVVEGFESVVLKRIQQMPGMGFLTEDKHVLIEYMKIMIPDRGTGDYVVWVDRSS